MVRKILVLALCLCLSFGISANALSSRDRLRTRVIQSGSAAPPATTTSAAAPTQSSTQIVIQTGSSHAASGSALPPAASTQTVTGSQSTSAAPAGSSTITISQVPVSQTQSGSQTGSQSGSQAGSQSGSGSSASGSSSGSGSSSSESSKSSSSSSSSSAIPICEPPKTCSYPVELHEAIDRDLKPVVGEPHQHKKEEKINPQKQGVLKPRPEFVEVEEDFIAATPVVALEVQAETAHPKKEHFVETKEHTNEKLPTLDTHFQLKSAAQQQDYDLSFDKDMGLAPTMSVSTIVIKNAERILPIADRRHYIFEERHAMNCRGPICPRPDAVSPM